MIVTLSTLIATVAWAQYATMPKGLELEAGGGYTGLVVGISNTVPEDYELIAMISEQMTQSSRTLYEAAEGLVFIKKVTIIAPANWEMPTEGDIERYGMNFKGVVTGVNFDQLPLQVYHTVEKDPLPMYTVKITPCGYRGRYMRVTDNYVRRHRDPAVLEKRGRFDRNFAREFAKLRWGVFDETPLKTSGKDAEFYVDPSLPPTESLTPIKCSYGLQGDIRYIEDYAGFRTGEMCDSKQHMYHGKCRFYPKDSPDSMQRWQGSLMYRTSVPSINTYCRDIESPKLRHLKHAPTIHNLKCNKKSVWDVATNSEDLRNRTVADTVFEETQIEVMIETARRIVVAIDLSTSMSKGNRFKSVMQAASIFLQSAAIDTFIGMISFNKNVQIRSNLVQITDDDTRKVLIARLPDMSELGMGTGLGGAVKAGVAILSGTGPESLRSTGGEILLLTDGVETEKPFLSEILDDVKQSGVRVNAISLGVEAIDGVEMISMETGGSNSFATSAADGTNHMLQTLSSAFLAQFQNDEGQPLTVVSESVPIKGETKVPFVLDNSVGRDTNIFLSWNGDDEPKIKLRLPNDDIVADNWVSNDFQTEIIYEPVKFSTATIKIVGLAVVGRYDVIVLNEGAATLQVTCTVNSFPRDESYPVKMQTHAVNRESGEVSIFAEVSQGLFPVLDATLYAQLIHPELNETSVDTVKYYLHDDGLDDDLNAEDGVYTTTVSPPQDGIAYIIKVVGIGEGTNAYVSRQHFVGWGPKEGLQVRSAGDRVRREATNTETLKSDQISFGPGAKESLEIRLDGKKTAKYEVIVNGYFDDSDIKLLVPVVNAEIVCCEEYHNGPQNFTITFGNDQANDILQINIGTNALKGKYELKLRNGAGRGQLVRYSIDRIDASGEMEEPTEFTRTTSMTLRSNHAARCPKKFLYYKLNCWYSGHNELLSYKTAKEQCETFGAELPTVTDEKGRVENFKWAVYNNYPHYQFWLSEESTGRQSNPAIAPGEIYNRSYSSNELDFPTAQEFADFQEEVRQQRALANQSEQDYDALYGPSCAYFSGRKSTKGHINDAIIKEPQACALELPFTCIFKIPDKVPPKQIVDIDLEVIDQEEVRKNANNPAHISQERSDTFLGKEFREDDAKYVPEKNLTYKLTFTTPKDAGISKNLTTEIRMFLDPNAKFEEGRLVKEVSSKEKADVVLTDEELTKCPPNLPVDLKFWLHTQSDAINLEAARLIEEVIASTLHMGPQETNLLFDIWMGNSSEQGRHSPVHAIFAEKYKPRVSYTGEVYQQHHIWIGDVALKSRVTKLKTNTTKLSDLPGVPMVERKPIKFLVEKRVDQSRSMVTSPADWARDLIGQAKMRDIIEALCTQQVYFNRQIRAAAKDADGNLAEESLGRSFIQILSKAEPTKFYAIKVPQPARQEEIQQVVVKKNTGAIAGTIAGVAVAAGALIGCALFSGKIKNAFTGGGGGGGGGGGKKGKKGAPSKKGDKKGAKGGGKGGGKKGGGKKGGAKKGAKKKGKK